ncbi:hypothetical protein [Stenotrophomonas sp.]|uniref:hypothetical protein n=1 Tax=Stenotrophomonas sp. TaxID=69392 RepID=UPI0028A261B6|nr:hypothetical protein [Stenotrophomonas sp.]
MTARIYDRPDLDQRRGELALYVIGSLIDAVPSAAYEGRLQIINSIGACTVRQIDGDRLPEGTRLFVDQATKEVVVAWPGYVEGAAPIANPGFEEGNTGWERGAGWVIATENPPVGSWAAGYNNNNGQSVISNTARYRTFPGQRTTAKCKVRQGASAEGNAGASVLLEYRDTAGQVVLTVEGNRVMSASKNRVYDSNVIGDAPAGAETVNIASNGIRFRENKILFVDAFEWDHTVAASGINHEAEIALTLLVSDSRGRSAVWSGSIRVVEFPDTRWGLLFGRNLWIAENSDSFPTAQQNIFGDGNTVTTQLQVNGVISCANAPSSVGATFYSDMPVFSVKGIQQEATRRLALAGRYIVSAFADGATNTRLDTTNGTVLSQPATGGGDVFGDEVVLIQYNSANNNVFTYSYSFNTGTSWVINGPSAIGFPQQLAGVGNRGVTAMGGTEAGVFRCQFLSRPENGVDEIVSFPISAQVIDMAYCREGWMAVFADGSTITRVWDRSAGWVAKSPVPTAGVVRTLAANSRVILAGTSLGEIFRSVDFGETWQQMPVGTIAGDFQAIRVYGEQMRSREVFPGPPEPSIYIDETGSQYVDESNDPYIG